MKKLLFVFLMIVVFCGVSLWGQNTFKFQISSYPAGAKVEIRDFYSFPNTYTTLGTTPYEYNVLQNSYLLRFSKDGYITREEYINITEDTFITSYLSKEININFNITPSTGIKITLVHKDRNNTNILHSIVYNSIDSLNTYKFITFDNYDITVEKTGYETYIKSFTASENNTNININLKTPATIKSDIAGAKVYIYPDNKEVITPATYNFAKDVTYSLSFSYPPYFSDSKTISFVGGTSSEINLSVNDLTPNYNREMVWSKNTIGESTYFKNMLYDSVKTKFNEIKDKYTVLKLNDTERNYYFSNDNIGNDTDNDEYITLKDVTVSGRHVFEIDHMNGTVEKDGDFFVRYYLALRINGGKPDFYKEGELREKNLYVGDVGAGGPLNHKTHDDGSQNIQEIFTVNSIDTNVSKDLYFPNILETSKPSFTLITTSGTTFVGTNPVWYRLHWESVSVSDKNWYKARSPRPQITTTNLNPIVNIKENKFGLTTIKLQHRVKILGYDIYKKVNGSWTKQGDTSLWTSLDDEGIGGNSTDFTVTASDIMPKLVSKQIGYTEFNIILNKLENNDKTFMLAYYIPNAENTFYTLKDGIDFSITQQIFDKFSLAGYIDGEYAIVLGAIDKFNKFYMFEPEKFALDVAPPEITDLQIVSKDNFNKDNPIIMKWQKIDDTVSPFPKQSDYLKFSYTFYDGAIYYPYSSKKFSEVSSIFDITTGIEKINNVDVSYNYLKLKNEGKLDIQRIYMVDAIGNQKDLLTETSYIYDKTPPEITYNNSYDGKVFNINDEFKINFTDKFSDINVNNITVTYNIDKNYTVNDFILSNNGFIYIPLENMEGYEGNFTISMNISDDKNNKITPSPSYTFKIDDKAPVLTLSFLDNLGNPITNIIDPINLPSTTFKINVTDTNFTKSKVTITSDYMTSSNIFPVANGSNEITVKDWTKSLSTNTNRVYENISITVESYDTNNNTTTQTRNIRLYNDIEAPEIIKSSPTTSTENGQAYTLTIKDKTAIKEVAIKLIPQLNTTRDNFGDINENNNWIIIAKDINNNEQIEESISRNVYVFPTYSLCIVAKDCWDKESYTIIENTNANTYSIIDSKEALLQQFPKVNNVININSNIIYKPKDSTKLTLIIEPDEILNIQTNAGVEPRVIYLDGAGYQDKIKIENKGKIIFDNTNNQIKLLGLSGTNSDSYNYSWFGIKNTNTTSTNAVIEIKNQIDLTKKITFNNAIAPLTFINPANSILLKNIAFENSFMGVHYIVDNYNASNSLLLQVFSCSFTSLIYGIKFDVNNIYIGDNKKFNYSEYLNYDNTCTFTNILKGNISSP